LHTSLLWFATTWVTGAWRKSIPLSDQVKHPYTISGDLPNPDNANFALDSAYALWASTTRWGTGNPGRLLQEIRKEACAAHYFRRMVPWQQVEFHSFSSEARADLYVPTPIWWFSDGWTRPTCLRPCRLSLPIALRACYNRPTSKRKRQSIGGKCGTLYSRTGKGEHDEVTIL
jgi:hypothetical protein